jgi:hypothetical protein
MKQNETKNPQKIFKYLCEYCEYTSRNKKDYNKHLLTLKHKSFVNETILKQKSPEIPKNPQVLPKLSCICGKIYNSRTTLWRHKKQCFQEVIPDDKLSEDNLSDKDLIMLLIKENSELKNIVLDVCQKINPLNNIINSNNITNSHNKSFNLNFFLNETCKDAMNIMDFVDSIKLQLSDLEKVGEVGYVNGISNIIVKNLNALEVEKRPIHCADKKRETLYIKDEDKWEKEDDQKNKLRKAIKKVASKNQRLIPKFKEIHPDCIKAVSKFSDQYNKMIIESMGGAGDNDIEKENKIIKNISKNVIIDKIL